MTLHNFKISITVFHYKNKGKLEVICRRIECLFRLRYVSSGWGWNIDVRCDIHNHRLVEDLDSRDTLNRLRSEER